MMISEPHFNQTHGMSKTRIYRVWEGIKRRLYDKKEPNYVKYGARGIKMSKKWKNDFVEFFDYVKTLDNCPEESLLVSLGGSGKRSMYSLDRIDNLKGYIPGNLRWADARVQARNRRSTKHIKYKGKLVCLAQFCEDQDLNYKSAWQQLNRGWAIKEILNARPEV